MLALALAAMVAIGLDPTAIGRDVLEWLGRLT